MYSAFGAKPNACDGRPEAGGAWPHAERLLSISALCLVGIVIWIRSLPFAKVEGGGDLLFCHYRRTPAISPCAALPTRDGSV